MNASPRGRLWVETSLAAVAAILLGVTLVSKEWIEIVFRIDPDDGSGSLEWAIVGALAAACVGCILLARAEWRRTPSAP